MISNEVPYILLPDYAAHEVVYHSQAIASDEYAFIRIRTSYLLSTADGPDILHHIAGEIIKPAYQAIEYKTV